MASHGKGSPMPKKQMKLREQEDPLLSSYGREGEERCYLA